MRFLFLSVVFLLALSLSVQAQNHTVLTLGFGRTPATEVYIVNDADDGSVLRVSGSGEKIPKTLAKADRWKKVYPIGYGDAPIFIEACKEGPVAYTIIPPPSWAMDARTVGNAALTTQYLVSNPSRSSLGKSVKNIEAALRDSLGRKEMVKEIQAWFHGVDALGLEHTGPSCQNPKMLAIRVRVQDFWYERLAVVLTIRGNRTNGYKIDGPRNAWY